MHSKDKRIVVTLDAGSTKIDTYAYALSELDKR